MNHHSARKEGDWGRYICQLLKECSFKELHQTIDSKRKVDLPYPEARIKTPQLWSNLLFYYEATAGRVCMGCDLNG